MTSEQKYYDRIEEWAISLGSDGCTGATNAYRHCCLEHDCHVRAKKTLSGRPISRDETDQRFWACLVRSSRFGYFNPMAWWRYVIVTKVKHRGSPWKEAA
jgi:hypothetical protein